MQNYEFTPQNKEETKGNNEAIEQTKSKKKRLRKKQFEQTKQVDDEIEECKEIQKSNLPP